MKRLTAAVSAVLFIILVAGCSSNREIDMPALNEAKSGKIQIVATLFPQYDFAKQIAGEKADVTLLLPPGVESHSFEPTPSDIVRINQSDLFLYTGKYMEAWSEKIIGSMKDSGSESLVLDLSKNIALVNTEEIEAGHHHSDAEESEEHHHGNEAEQGHGHQHQYDPHIWTDPMNAKLMAADIRDALCTIDPANKGYYNANAERYLAELDALDAEFRSVVRDGKRNKILYGSRFPFYYFAKRYRLDYGAAFDSCSSETEPSARAVAGLIKEIREEKIPVVYYAEMEDPKVARSICSETGTKMLLLHSCHNVTKEEMEQGATYLSLMKQNAENLKEGLE